AVTDSLIGSVVGRTTRSKTSDDTTAGYIEPRFRRISWFVAQGVFRKANRYSELPTSTAVSSVNPELAMLWSCRAVTNVTAPRFGRTLDSRISPALTSYLAREGRSPHLNVSGRTSPS